MRPVTQPLGTAYGVKGSHWAAGRHTGVDYLTPTGTPVRAAVGGNVLHAGANSSTGWGAAYGVHVITQATIKGTSYRLLYAHLNGVTVRAGQTVTTGQRVGYSGRTGNTTGPHLHFEVRRPPFAYGNDVNPQIAVDVPEKDMPSRVANARKDLQTALGRLDRAIKAGRGQPVKLAREAVRDALNRLPKS